MNQEELKKVLQTIYRNIRCPACGKKYDFSNIHIKGFLNNLCFLQLECPNHLPLFATIATPLNSAKKIPVELIDDNTVISAYESLKNYQGKLSEIIK
jgi:hypothetical protein